jgi:lipopolysaccharide export system protein LptA
MTRWLALCAAVAAFAAPGLAAAEGPRPANGTPSFIHGAQSQNRDQPIQIESATLEVRDKNKTATFAGNVVVVQGDTTMKCQKLVVFYGPEEGSAVAKQAAPTAPRATPTITGGVPQDAHDIRRIEAYTDVTVTTKDQNATGDVGVYDLRSKTITLTGNVVVSQGKNVVRGDRVVVDTTTGYSRIESATAAPSRVRALILPNKGNGSGPSNIMSFGPKN